MEDGTTRIRVMLVDDNLGFRSLMEALLSGHSDLEVVAQAGSLAEARGYAAKVEVTWRSWTRDCPTEMEWT